MKSTITSKGQTTVPKPVRVALGLKARSRVVYEVCGDYVVMRPAGRAVDELFGSLKAKARRPAAKRREERAVAARALGGRHKR